MEDGKRVALSVRVSEDVASAVDAARGDQSRSVWLQSAIMTALRDAAERLVAQAVSAPGSRRAAKPKRITAKPAPAPDAAREVPFSSPPARKAAPHRCPVKGWCETCGEWKPAKAR